MKDSILDKIENDKLLKNWFELNPYAISIYDENGHFLYSNKAHINMFKQTHPPTSDYCIFKDPNVEGNPSYSELLRKLKKGEVVNFPEMHYNVHLADSRYEKTDLYMKTVIFPLENDDGQIRNFIFIHEDVTKRKKAELKLKQLRKELEKRVKHRTIMLESSEKKFRKAYNRANCFKGLFTHDISNILQVTGNALEYSVLLLKDGDNIEKILDYFELIKNQLNRGKKLIQNILNLSEMEQSEMPLETVNVNRNLNDAVEFLAINFPHKKIETILEDDGMEYYVRANELILDVFENILINAVRYNNNSNIKLTIKISELNHEQKEYIKLEFKDNGIGIKDSFKQEIFDKPIDLMKEIKGLGLGLSLVAKFLELCEGDIWVENRIEGDHTKGSNFIILLPKAKINS